MTYQSFDGVSDSNSPAKLKRLHLPADLTDHAVLDVGCNDVFGDALSEFGYSQAPLESGRHSSSVAGTDLTRDT